MCVNVSAHIHTRWSYAGENACVAILRFQDMDRLKFHAPVLQARIVHLLALASIHKLRRMVPNAKTKLPQFRRYRTGRRRRWSVLVSCVQVR